MAVVSSGTGQESSGSFAKVTGFLKVKDVLINPTKEELEAYGVSWKEPNYEFESSDRGKAQVIEFYFKVDESNFKKEDNAPKDVVLSTRMYLYPTKVVSQSGKKQYVNKYGKFAYAESVDAIYPNFSRDGIREAYDGEEGIINFLSAWGDTRKGDELMLDTILDIAKGNITELKTLEKAWSTRKLKVLVGLKDLGDNKFVHVVYPKAYWRVFADSMLVKVDGENVFLKYQEALPMILDDEYGKFKAADVVTVEPKVWQQDQLESVQPDDNASAPKTASSGPVSPF